MKTSFNYVEHYQRDAEVFDYFEPIASAVDRAERARLDQMIIDAIPSGTTSVLDVGCGNAWLARAIVDKQTTVVSMDVSVRNPVRALEIFPHPRHEALTADVYHLPIKKNTLDCIVASEIMEHVPDPVLFVEKLLEVLKPGGKLIVTTPYNEKIQYHLCVHCNRPTPSHAHLHSFHEKNVQALIPASARESKIHKFSHKYLNKARLYAVMKNWPFGTWKKVDQTVNRVWPHPLRMLLEVVK